MILPPFLACETCSLPDALELCESCSHNAEAIDAYQAELLKVGKLAEEEEATSDGRSLAIALLWLSLFGAVFAFHGFGVACVFSALSVAVCLFAQAHGKAKGGA